MLRKMKPGQPGTKQLSAQYGERLVCVRYRYDAQTRKRIKTAEIVVAESEWLPPAQRFSKDEIVWLRIGFVDRPRHQQLRAAGGKWDDRRCVWNIRYDAAVKLGFEAHVERREVSP
jgi:hypothetical protein